jgi:hypothetical protein
MTVYTDATCLVITRLEYRSDRERVADCASVFIIAYQFRVRQQRATSFKVLYHILHLTDFLFVHIIRICKERYII